VAALAAALDISPRWLMIGAALVLPWGWLVLMDRAIRRRR
jgi:hypothetical protein